MNEKISVIVPIYNVQNELNRCIESIVNQTYDNLEIILVDDGSPDNCPMMCDKWAAKDERIVVIHKINGGLSDARNVGLNKANGKYVLYVDSDDYIELDACQKLIENMTDDVDFVMGDYKEIRDDSIHVNKRKHIKSKAIYDARKIMILAIKNKEMEAPAWLNLYRRDFLLQNNLFFLKGYNHEDVEILPRLFLAAHKIVYVEYPFYNYIIRENSIMTSAISEDNKKKTIEIYHNWMEIIEKINDKKLKKAWIGFYLKMYLHHAREKKIIGWNDEKITLLLIIKNSLDVKELIKNIVFSIAPNIYVKL